MRFAPHGQRLGFMLPDGSAQAGPAIQSISGISKSYTRGDTRVCAVRDVGIDFRTGGVIGLLGPNGSGKSTLVRILSGLCIPDSGDIVFAGQGTRQSATLRDIGVLLEGRTNLNERLSTFENARYYCALRERSFDRRFFAHLVDRLGLPDAYCPIRQLSTGLKLRSALLLAFIHRPSMLLLDEPTLGLDLPGIASLEETIAGLSAGGTSFLVSSHDLAFLERICERIVCLKAGAVAFDGSVDSFRTLEYAYKVHATFSPGLDHVPDGWENAQRMGQDATLFLKTHEDLCRFIGRVRPSLERLQVFEVSRLTLHDKYMQLLAAEAAPRETKP